MINAIIVEDEAVAARRMQRLLEARGIHILQVIGSNRALEAYLNSENKPDIFFMDIHLSDGVVFDLLSQQSLDVPIIFTTAYDQYAIKAFKQNSIDYLLKPIDEEELDNAISKFKKSNKSIDIALISSMLSASQSTQEYKERISVRIGDKIRTINMSDIQFFYSSQKINYLYNNKGRSYPIDYSIEEISKKLKPSDFYRVSRGHIVNISAITDVIAYSNSRLKVVVAGAEDHEIVVSRERVKSFKEWLG